MEPRPSEHTHRQGFPRFEVPGFVKRKAREGRCCTVLMTLAGSLLLEPFGERAATNPAGVVMCERPLSFLGIPPP